MIIDEEQRFGVEHKEHLKALRTHVDVLTMSATPIPRTLEMARQRHPGDVDDPDAAGGTAPGPDVRRRLRREAGRPRPCVASCCARARSSTCTTGSESIERAAARLRELVPEARIEVAHGQMGEHQLEEMIVRFWEQATSTCSCARPSSRAGWTSPTRTRLIVERADTLGPGPAAPAARSGRAWSRARLRLLPVPAGEAADRDRARPAGDHRPAHRPRRRAWPWR